MDLLDAEYQVMGDDGIEDAEVMEVDVAMEFGAPSYRDEEDPAYGQKPYNDWDFDDMVDFPDDD